jgi:hypothetical protein
VPSRSTERAVDPDLGEGACERRELVIVELADEQLGDAADVNRRDLLQARGAGIGQLDHDASPVRIGARSSDESLLSEPRDPTGHSGAGDQRLCREVGHAQAATGDRQLGKDVEVGKRQAALTLEVGLHLADERGMCCQQRLPGSDASTGWQLAFDEPIQESAQLRSGGYLRVQSGAQNTCRGKYNKPATDGILNITAPDLPSRQPAWRLRRPAAVNARGAALLAVGILITACQAPGESAPGVTVSGTAVSGPSCPVVTEPPDPACDDRPVADAEIVVVDAAGTEVARVRTDGGGRFSVELAAGEYRLVPQPVQGLMGTPPEVGVVVHDTDVDVGLIAYDTGIR